VDALAGGDTRALAGLVHNRLEEAAAALSPWVNRLRDEFAREDCLAARLSGSGTAYFGICRHARHARRVARRLHARQLGWVSAVSTTN
jgi:4-diphosphocytidyl-2-C-methyl-D-erythritol kinase